MDRQHKEGWSVAIQYNWSQRGGKCNCYKCMHTLTHPHPHTKAARLLSQPLIFANIQNLNCLPSQHQDSFIVIFEIVDYQSFLGSSQMQKIMMLWVGNLASLTHTDMDGERQAVCVCQQGELCWLPSLLSTTTHSTQQQQHHVAHKQLCHSALGLQH